VGKDVLVSNRSKVNDKGKKIIVDHCVTRPMTRYVPPHMRQACQKFVLTCHHCGKVDHI
jgi:hypothetical protein